MSIDRLTLRQKTLAVLVLTLIGLFVGLYVTSRFIVVQGFAEQEHEDTRQNVERVRSALNDETTTLKTLVYDWAVWDDTYGFIEDGNDAYIQSNLVDETLINLRLNLSLFIDSSGRTIYAKAFDLREGTEIPIPQSFEEYLADDGMLLDFKSPTNYAVGLISLPEGPMIVASHPIVTSAQEGPIRGTVIFGRYLDTAEIERLSRTTLLTLSARPISDGELPADYQSALASLSTGTPVVVEPLSSNDIGGYTLLTDIHGKPALVLRAEMSRGVYQRGRTTEVYLMSALLAVGLVFGLVVLLLMEKVVLSRLARLSAGVERIGTIGDASARVSVPGSDELARLAGGINRMLQPFEKSQDKRKRAEATIHHMSFYDPLTDLPNRSLFNRRTRVAVAQALRKGKMGAVLFVDLDDFKLINDTLGQDVGDRVLLSVAERLNEHVREGTVIARQGGDEFMILAPSLDDVADAESISREILEALNRPFYVDGHELHVTASAGVTIFPRDGEDPEILLQNADTAVYHAKGLGKNAYQFFTPAMHSSQLKRLNLENSLRGALDRGEFVVHYQPQVDARSRRIIGAEALVRWQHSEQGLIYPGEFIPVAEESGLIVPIGEMVLYSACRQARIWEEAGLSPVRVTVNLSARQFQQEDLVETVARALKETRLERRYLELEITESIAMRDADVTIEVLRDLKAQGVRVALDDFGTGYSSLSYLKEFPLDILKIDRSFVCELPTNTNDAHITNAVISLGHALDLEVVAEGVETEAQLQFLCSHGCDIIQGYLFGRAVPPEEFLKEMRQERVLVAAA